MKLEFLKQAENDLIEAIAYYEEKEPGLGLKLRDEVRKVCSSIANDPCLWREREGGYRRVNCPIFPYYVPYFIRNDVTIIAAIAHEKQSPVFSTERK